MVHKITTVVSSTQTSSQPTQTTSVTSEKIDATVTISNYKLMQEEADSVKVTSIAVFDISVQNGDFQWGQSG